MKWKQTAVIALLLTIFMTWPAPRYLTTQLIGNNIDNWIFYWNNWWIQQASQGAGNWFFTDYLFYPTGTTLVAHSYSFLNSLLAWPLQKVLGGIGAYNFVFLLGLWFGFMGMSLLVYTLTQNHKAAWGAAFVFTFAPYHLTQALAHGHLGSIHMWPWAIWANHQLWQTKGWRYAGWLGLFTALTLWSGLQLALLWVLWLAVYVLWELGQSKSWQVLKQYAVAGGVALLLSLPLLWPIAKEWSGLSDNIANFDESTTKQTDVLAYIVPPTYNPIVGEIVQPIYEKFEANRAVMPYIGVTVLLLVGLGTWHEKGKGENGRYLLLTILAFIFALGSELRFNGQVYQAIPLPYSWFAAIFPFSTIRAPDRFNLLLLLSLSPLVGMGLSHIKNHWIMVLCAIGLVIEYASWPLPMWDNIPPPSPFITTLAQTTEEVAILDYPMGYSDSKLWLYYQTLHHKPIAEGHVSRYTEETYQTIAHNAVLQTLYQVADKPPYLPPEVILPTEAPLGIGLRQLEEIGVRYILRHISYETPSQAAYFDQHLPLISQYRDEAIWVYDLSQPRQDQPTPIIGSLSSNIDILEAWAQVLEGQLVVSVVGQRTDNGQDKCSVELGEDTLPLTLFEDAFDWQIGDLDWQTVRINLPREGSHSWQIHCRDTYTSPQILSMTPYPHLHRDTTPFVWQEGMTMQAYDWWIDNTRLFFNFYWQTEHPIDADYKLFVHIVDERETLVAQIDTMPCQWTCPTSTWPPGQWMADTTMVDIWGLPAGIYQIVVGFYDEATGERLLVRNEGETADFVTLPSPLQIGQR